MHKKAIALLSGGLDSSLAVKLMIDQGIEVVAINFMSPFCNCTPKKSGCRHQAQLIAHELGIEIHAIPKGMDYLAMVKRPPHGYGRGMNPCIDCRIYMLRKARERMDSLGASFVVTGEVLGQRPMSHRQAIRIIEKERPDRLIRGPLSRPFEPSIPEQEGIVDRRSSLDSGRSRKPQIELAEELGIKDYPCPAGGCLLTDPVIASRLRDLFTYQPDFDMTDIHLLKVGRHFRIDAKLKVVLGRNKAENEKVTSLVKPGYAIIQPADFRGPAALVTGIPDRDQERLIGEIVARYSADAHDRYVLRKQIVNRKTSSFSVAGKIQPETLEAFQIGHGTCWEGKEEHEKRIFDEHIH